MIIRSSDLVGKFIKRMILFLILLLCIGGGWYVWQLKKHVTQTLQWEPLVKSVLQEENLVDYEDLVLAIIFTETKGNSVDIMQSSESKYGEQNKISSEKESITSGVRHLSEAIKYSLDNGCDIWTGVQAYNFGTSYVDYVVKHGKKNSLALAEDYSKTVLAPMLGNTTAATYRYYEPFALLHNGGLLYQNGGNFFYAELVKRNMTLIRILS